VAVVSTCHRVAVSPVRLIAKYAPRQHPATSAKLTPHSSTPSAHSLPVILAVRLAPAASLPAPLVHQTTTSTTVSASPLVRQAPTPPTISALL
jgi:hypothetical protein